jgi:SpoVK/Ycf46/Vps4 family AAA+-type ATPase
MNLAVKNLAYKNFLEQAKEAHDKQDLQRAKELYLKAASITNEISLQAENSDIKKEFHQITKKLIDIVRTFQSVETKNSEIKSSNVHTKDKEVAVTVTLEEALNSLNVLIGLDNVKKQVNNWVNVIQVFQKREKSGLKVPPMNYHLVFTGNPGTGKTTVARIMSQIYHGLGILKKGHLVEVGRDGLVGKYVGHSEELTKAKINEALGGVLFIDEAYALVAGDNDFGKQVIDVLVQYMENYRDNLVVIVAGYTENMERFISSNHGLASRFKTFVDFKDYTPIELLNIFKKLCTDYDYKMHVDLIEFLMVYFDDIYSNRKENFGNARDVRNLFEKMITQQSSRVLQVESPSVDVLMTLRVEDF